MTSVFDNKLPQGVKKVEKKVAEATSADLLEMFRSGVGDAADELFRRYVARLTHLARTRLSPRLARRLDAEDVVLSAYRSFFLGARDGRFSLERSGDLWRLLVSITLHKLHRQAAHHAAEKRDWRKEALSEKYDVARLIKEPEPDVADALAVADELEHVMRVLDAPRRRILELRLLEWPLDLIAADVGRSERTVRRMLDEVRQVLERRFADDAAATWQDR